MYWKSYQPLSNLQYIFWSLTLKLGTLRLHIHGTWIAPSSLLRSIAGLFIRTKVAHAPHATVLTHTHEALYFAYAFLTHFFICISQLFCSLFIVKWPQNINQRKTQTDDIKRNDKRQFFFLLKLCDLVVLFHFSTTLQLSSTFIVNLEISQTKILSHTITPGFVLEQSLFYKCNHRSNDKPGSPIQTTRSNGKFSTARWATVAVHCRIT